MVSQVNQIIVIIIISANVLYFLHCLFVSGKKPIGETVMKINSFTLLSAVSVIFILAIFESAYFEWIKESILLIAIVAILTITTALQIFWKGKSKR